MNSHKTTFGLKQNMGNNFFLYASNDDSTGKGNCVMIANGTTVFIPILEHVAWGFYGQMLATGCYNVMSTKDCFNFNGWNK